MKQFSILLTGVLALCVSGCYTQFAMVDRTEPPPEEVEWVVDSATGDTVRVIREVDTVETDDGQTCVWERDLMGYPYLRCYDSFYPRDWFYYNYSPWWYRNDPYWYDYRRCPRYYYYDPSCGCCRYTSGDYHYGRYHYGSGGSSKKEPTGPSGSSMYPRVRGISDPKSAGSTTKSSSKIVSPSSKTSAATASESRKSGKIVIPASGKTSKKTRGRSRGILEKSSTPAPSTAGSPKSSGSGTGKSKSPSKPSVTPRNGSSAPQPPPSEGREQKTSRRRRKPRSW